MKEIEAFARRGKRGSKMKFERLKIIGFKTFVDQTEFMIERGLTGVVGPNGCGKSNLVEALRWVMGETSHKSMRASGMDDVIFSGSGNRPSRNVAEVLLTINNADKLAPAMFNDADMLEISRRIEREEGSTYRINGREVRARDVQLLFADAASGARSPALVRQGQIGEIIAAKPQQRRRILEDAAGIAGLYSRRHEAELRLRAAEDNLLRLDDVMRHLGEQIDSLSKQARQATRYRAISAEIRKHEALVFYLGLAEAGAALKDAERQLDLDTRLVAERTSRQGEAARALAVAEHEMEPLRQREAERGAALQRLRLAREQIDGEEARIKERGADLARRLQELQRDREREAHLAQDAARALDALSAEEASLATARHGPQEQAALAARLEAAEQALAREEKALGDGQQALAELNARRQAAERAAHDASQRLTRAEAQLAEAERQLAALAAAGHGPDMAALAQTAAQAATAVAAGEAEAAAAEAALAAARQAEARQRPRLSEAERQSQRLDTELRTLRKLLDSGTSDMWPSVLDQITAAKGYEIALGAALGDDLEASTAPTAPLHWLETEAGADPALPHGIGALSAHVQAPAALKRRLDQIGVVTRGDGPRLRLLLKPGQRLVSQEGDLWRWDGLTAAAEAPTAAARRLDERNRLHDLDKAATEAQGALASERREMETRLAAVKQAGAAEAQAREAARQARRAQDSARETLAAAERRHAETMARIAALEETAKGLAVNRDAGRAEHQRAQAALEGFQPDGALRAIIAERQAAVAERRTDAAEARATLQGARREEELRQQRLATIARETAAWRERQGLTTERRQAIEAREAEITREREALEEAPAALAARRRALTGEMEVAEAALREAGDARAVAESRRLDADRTAKAALAGLSEAREARARTEALMEAARAKLEDTGRIIVETLDASLSELPRLAGIESDRGDLPPLREVEERVAALRRERERLGGVNLRADDELQEVESRRDGLTTERNDLTEAIGKLRRAIQNLNAEGRERLLAAFDNVNSAFQRLFTTLFGGGSAELQLVESDDPLDAGLEIYARPPGKKPQVLTLLSGGEQALTAIALIFAVFLTNPSPVCVLDEIDAPLDDHNVERLCDLLDEMRATTETRFIVISHNPITMARMDRLFGVTMAERGVSQLVSVDLEAAAELAEAG